MCAACSCAPLCVSTDTVQILPGKAKGKVASDDSSEASSKEDYGEDDEDEEGEYEVEEDEEDLKEDSDSDGEACDARQVWRWRAPQETRAAACVDVSDEKTLRPIYNCHT